LTQKEIALAPNWKVIEVAEHEKLPAKTNLAARDPEWEAALDVLESGQPVTLSYANDQERGTLGRSVGRRASFRGFRVDIRQGAGYISVMKSGDKPAKGTKARRK